MGSHRVQHNSSDSSSSNRSNQWTSLVAQLVKNLPAMQETLIRFLVGKILWRRERLLTPVLLGFPCGSASKESTCNAGDLGLISGLGKFPRRRDRLPTPVFLDFLGGSAGKESTCNAGDLGLISDLGRSPGKGKGYPLLLAWRIPWGHKSDKTE